MKNTREQNEQKVISYKMESRFREKFPMDRFKIRRHEDDSIDILLIKQRILLWITTRDTEITLGFDNSEGKCVWHTHMDLHDAFTDDDQIAKVLEIISGILNDKIMFIIGKCNWIVLDEKDKNEYIGDENQLLYWSNL